MNHILIGPETKLKKTEWHKIVMWNKAAENAQAFLKKGSLVYVEGKIETRSWENDSGEKDIPQK